jgi:hypothetical protein
VSFCLENCNNVQMLRPCVQQNENLSPVRCFRFLLRQQILRPATYTAQCLPPLSKSETCLSHTVTIDMTSWLSEKHYVGAYLLPLSS